MDYHKASVSVQLGLDKAMETEWQKYVEFNAVVPCTAKEMNELIRAGHVCIYPRSRSLPTKMSTWLERPAIRLSGRLN